MGFWGIMKEVITLTENVKRLQNDLDTLVNQVRENQKQLIESKAREAILIAEIARNTTESVNTYVRDIERRLADLEAHLHLARKVKSRELPPTRLPDSE